MTPAGSWSQANDDGFGDESNDEIDALAEFNGYLYAATFTWVCDDPNCNTHHSNGPQVYRSADGSTWQLAAPAGGLGGGYCYISTLTVFNGYLYAGVGSGDQTHGAEIWRTVDGLTWTRAMENGFNNDVYNSQVTSLTVHNGNLYAGTVHFDWYDDGHPDGPLGGEVWRSNDGTTWTRVNAPGFGDLWAHRIDQLIVFQNALYAYASHHWASNTGADIWRCTNSVCSAQADWVRVADNGFGVPKNQYLYGSAVANGYLYSAAYNATTGMQLWRTANGSQWTKATPYDGLGTNNNLHAYINAMTTFGGRLMLGVTNDANGAGVWQKTVTADFSATPLTGRPPLAVSFSNASGSDYTSSLWDFGDGQTSTAANPTHTYSQAGAYTVRLTVSDGMDSHTLTRPGYVSAWYRTFLPISAKNYDPLNDIYDSFDNPAYDGTFNPLLWSHDPNATQFRQQGGALVVTEPLSPNPTGGTLRAIRPQFRRWRDAQQVEARLKVSSDRIGTHSPIQLTVVVEEVNGHVWFASCSLSGAASGPQASVGCSVFIRQGSAYPVEYNTPGFLVDYDTWNTLRIQANPTTGTLRFYLNNTLIGTHTPADAAQLVATDGLQVLVTAWGIAPNSAATRYVDDVRITPTQ